MKNYWKILAIVFEDTVVTHVAVVISVLAVSKPNNATQRSDTPDPTFNLARWERG